GQRGKRGSIAKWLGISVDEAHRMKRDRSPTFVNTFPLVELGWTRQDCRDYARSHGFDPPKSRCYFCPYVSDWGAIAREHPEEFERAVEHDQLIREEADERVRSKCYVHRSLQPLSEAVIEQRQGVIWKGYQPDATLDDFADECEGMCGT
ncbi:MAG: hypothetical protein AAFY15_04565, partial [Cyanobacteria bacterium J06648_11]